MEAIRGFAKKWFIPLLGIWLILMALSMASIFSLSMPLMAFCTFALGVFGLLAS